MKLEIEVIENVEEVDNYSCCWQGGGNTPGPNC